MSYQVALDTFHGPLDLLLYLVRKNEVDVLDIPVAKIADQFMDYLQLMQDLDVELAGDFLVMAATLMEVKSRMLVPAEPEEGKTAGTRTRGKNWSSSCWSIESSRTRRRHLKNEPRNTELGWHEFRRRSQPHRGMHPFGP